MEWMGRRLRRIDGAGEIKEWAAAMSALNIVFKEIEIKGSSDNWRPWKKPMEETTEDLMKTGSLRRDGKLSCMKSLATEKIETRKNPILYGDCPPRVQVEWEDEDMNDPKAGVMEMLSKAEIDTRSESLDLDGNEIISGAVVPTKRDADADLVNKVLIGTTGKERLKGKSVDREKIKWWWKEALWRKLMVDNKEKKHWEGNEDFASLLISCGKDKELTRNLTQNFPKNTENSFLVVSRDELMIYLNKEMNNYYLWKT